MSMVAVVKVDAAWRQNADQMQAATALLFVGALRGTRIEWGSVHRPRIGQPCGADREHTQHCSTCSTCCGRLLLLPSSRDPSSDF